MAKLRITQIPSALRECARGAFALGLLLALWLILEQSVVNPRSSKSVSEVEKQHQLSRRLAVLPYNAIRLVIVSAKVSDNSWMSDTNTPPLLVHVALLASFGVKWNFGSKELSQFGSDLVLVGLGYGLLCLWIGPHSRACRLSSAPRFSDRNCVWRKNSFWEYKKNQQVLTWPFNTSGAKKDWKRGSPMEPWVPRLEAPGLKELKCSRIRWIVSRLPSISHGFSRSSSAVFGQKKRDDEIRTTEMMMTWWHDDDHEEISLYAVFRPEDWRARNFVWFVELDRRPINWIHIWFSDPRPNCNEVMSLLFRHLQSVALVPSGSWMLGNLLDLKLIST